MRIWQNPPAKKRKTRKGVRRLKRGPGGRFLPKVGRKSRKSKVSRHARRSGGAKMARKRKAAKSKVKKRSTRRKGVKRSKAFYAKIGRKGARTRARKKASRRAAARKAARSRKRKPKYTRGRKTRPTLRRYKGRYYAAPGSKVKGRRINPRRRRRSGRRRNPGLGAMSGLFPTKLSQFKDVAMVGAGGALGYLGVGYINRFADDAFLGAQKDKITSPILRSIVNGVQSVVATFILAGVSKMVIKGKPDITRGIFVGGATKAVLDIVLPFMAQAAAGGSAVAEAGVSGFQEQLSGYQYAGINGFQETSGMGYASQGFNRIAAMNNDDATIYG